MSKFASLGPQAFLTPVPVMLVGTFDSEGRPDIMPVTWGGICCLQPPCLAISVRRNTWTYRSVLARRAFTVSMPDRGMAAQADFCGLVSGRGVDKFKTLGLTPETGEHVDAPYVGECPAVMELLLRNVVELGSHVQFIGEIMDLKVSRDCMGEEGLPDYKRIDGISFAPLAKEYVSAGHFVSRAYAVGRTVRNVCEHGTDGRAGG